MFKTIFFLLLGAFAISQIKNPEGNNISFRVLIEDAQIALEELRETILGNILVAEEELGLLNTDFQTFSDNILIDGTAAIHQEEEIVFAELTTIKELAAGFDISYCLRGREDYLTTLSKVIIKNVGDCIFDKVEDASTVIVDANYFVDITINKVHSLEYGLSLCGIDHTASDLCVSPILEEIYLEMTSLPQNIKKEVNRARELLETLRLSIRECSDFKVAGYSSSANIILNDINVCVDNIIGIFSWS